MTRRRCNDESLFVTFTRLTRLDDVVCDIRRQFRCIINYLRDNIYIYI